MSESVSSVKLQRLLLMSDSDMAAAAQQLMQLSDEDNNSSSSNSNDNNNNDMKIKAKMTNSNSKRFFEQRYEITSAKIEEIFGKEDEVLKPIKKRRYRLLQNLYKETKPIKVAMQCKHIHSPAILVLVLVLGLIIILCGIFL